MTAASGHHYEPEWMFSDLPPLTPADPANWLKPATAVFRQHAWTLLRHKAQFGANMDIERKSR